MSDFQQKFMQLASQAYSTNMALVDRYTEDSVAAVTNLHRRMSELQYAEARLDDLCDWNRLRLYIGRIQDGYNADLRKYTKEFTEDANETYRNYDKKISNLLIDEGVRRKNIYNISEQSSEAEYANNLAKATNISVDSSLLDEVNMEIYNRCKKIFDRTKIIKIIALFCVPALIITLIIIAYTSTGNVEHSPSSDFYVLDDIYRIIDRGLGVIERTLRIPFYIGSVIVFLSLYIIYTLIANKIIKNNMISKLGFEVSAVNAVFLNKKQDLLDIYKCWLHAHFEEMNKRFFMRYKPLVEIAIKNSVIGDES